MLKLENYKNRGSTKLTEPVDLLLRSHDIGRKKPSEIQPVPLRHRKRGALKRNNKN